jgi:tetratricopeptide (TPR) repeat protein
MVDDPFDNLYWEGTELLHRGQPDEALPLLERAHELEPDHVDAGLNLGGAYILTKRFKRAIDVLEPMREIAAGNPVFWTNLGAAYLGNPILARDEEQQKAIRAFKHALDINPNAPNVAYNLGLIYRDRKEYEAARYWFERALEANPADRHARQILEKLSELNET